MTQVVTDWYAFSSVSEGTGFDSWTSYTATSAVETLSSGQLHDTNDLYYYDWLGVADVPAGATIDDLSIRLTGSRNSDLTDKTYNIAVTGSSYQSGSTWPTTSSSTLTKSGTWGRTNAQLLAIINGTSSSNAIHFYFYVVAGGASVASLNITAIEMQITYTAIAVDNIDGMDSGSLTSLDSVAWENISSKDGVTF